MDSNLTFWQKNLMMYRKAAGLTQKQLAEKVNVSPTTIAGYENAGKEPKISTLIKIADVFGVTIDELVREIPAEQKQSFRLRDELLKIVDKSLKQFETTSKPIEMNLKIIPADAQDTKEA